ncbi:hypothetical protein OOJ96_02325, partial [Pseudomonas sp. 15FMM2]
MKMAGVEIGLLQESDESFAEHLALNSTFRRLEAWLFQMLPSGRPTTHHPARAKIQYDRQVMPFP